MFMMFYYVRAFLLTPSCTLHRKKLGKIINVKHFCTYKTKNLDVDSYLNKKPSRRLVGFSEYVLLIVPITAFYLAFWQVRRKKWKDDLVAAVTIKPKLPVIDLPDDLTERSRLEYRRVRVKGTFDHSKEMYLGQTSRVDVEESKAKGFLFTDGTTDEKLGYYVITPFKLSDRNLTILVNRGWVPQNKADPKTRLEGQIEGEIELEGLVRLQQDKVPFIEDHDPRTRIFKYRDIARMAEQGNTSFLYIDAVKESTVPGGPIGGQTNLTFRNEHFSYILTWTGIGIVTSLLWFQKYILRK